MCIRTLFGYDTQQHSGQHMKVQLAFIGLFLFILNVLSSSVRHSYLFDILHVIREYDNAEWIYAILDFDGVIQADDRKSFERTYIRLVDICGQCYFDSIRLWRRKKSYHTILDLNFKWECKIFFVHFFLLNLQISELVDLVLVHSLVIHINGIYWFTRSSTLEEKEQFLSKHIDYFCWRTGTEPIPICGCVQCAHWADVHFDYPRYKCSVIYSMFIVN